MRRLVCTISAVFLFVACADSPTDLQDDLAGPQFKQVATDQGSISFTGVSTFNVYLPRTQEWFYKDYTCDAEGVLTFGENHDIALNVTEYGDCGGRNYTMYGTMTPSGALMFNLPDFFVPIIMEHTGCNPSGTFPVYHGSFDGESLSAATHFHGLCGEGTSWTDPNFPSDIPFPEGYVPVNAYFGFELTVVP